jgi:hypothetical protein
MNNMIRDALSPSALLRMFATEAARSGSHDFADELTIDADWHDALSRIESPNPPLTDTPEPCPPLHASVGGDLFPTSAGTDNSSSTGGDFLLTGDA